MEVHTTVFSSSTKMYTATSELRTVEMELLSATQGRWFSGA